MSGQPPVTLQSLLDYLPNAVSAVADENGRQQTPYWSVSGSLPANQWVLTDKAITFQELAPVASTKSRSHQDEPTLNPSFADWVGTWRCSFLTMPFEKVVEPSGAFVDNFMDGPSRRFVRSGRLNRFTGGRFSWLNDAGMNEGTTETGSDSLQGNQASHHYETGGFDIIWTRK